MIKNNLVIFCIPLSCLGHMNASVGLCWALKERGHRVVFGVERSWKGYFSKYGFEEQIYDERKPKQDYVNGQFWINKAANRSNEVRENNFEITRKAYEVFTAVVKFSNHRVREIIEQVIPDFIIQDSYVAYPCVVNSGIPYAVLWSSNPLVALNSPKLPPIDSAEPINDDRNWKQISDLRNDALRETWISFNKWMAENGSPFLKPYRFQYESTALNIELYPKFLFEDYVKRAELSDNWMLLEHAVQFRETDFTLPDEFLNKPGKLIYVSMGSMASADVLIMKHLVKLLSNAKHKIIISKGANFDKYEIADNMWGERSVPQLDVLKQCDLFITHGGNNGFTEALYFGVPMIVLPLFVDQYSNAQRLVEKNLGSKFEIFKVTEQELLREIDKILNDNELAERLRSISTSLRNSNSMNEIVAKIETIAQYQI